MALLGLSAEDDDGAAARAGHKPTTEAPQGGYRADSPPPPAKRASSAKPVPSGFTPACPTCKGKMWDNRPKKADGTFSAKSPDFKCRDKTCDGIIWKTADIEPEEGPPPPDDDAGVGNYRDMGGF
jgi:hypothetical protein